MNLVLNLNKIKTQALEKILYCPQYKEEPSLVTIELEKEFDGDTIIEQIKNSVELLNYDDTLKPVLIEIVELMKDNRRKFLIDEQKYISFYWNNMLILLLKINKDVKHNKQLHVSIQKYKEEISERISDRRLNRLLTLGVGGTIMLGVTIALVSFMKKQ